MKKYIFIIILSLIIDLLPITKINTILPKELPKFQIINQRNKDEVGTLIINKIQLKEKIFKINSTENNVDKHVTILKESIFPEKDNSIIFLAAHSGNGSIAYFQRLDEIQLKDEIILIYNSKRYNYEVKEIWEEKKNGFININKDIKKQLILTTCSPNKEGYQLVINCTEKESN